MTPKTDSRGKRYLPDLLLGLLPILIGIQLLGWITFFPDALLRGHADFRQLYTAGYMVRTGHAGELYDVHAQQQFQDALVGNDERSLPFIRPAYQALLFVPFSLLPYRDAYLIFLAVNWGLLAIAFWMLRPNMRNLFGIWRGLPVFIFLVFYPVALALMQGQDSIILLVLLTAALVALEQGRPFRGGVLIGLGLFKMQIVIPIALLFLLWRRWKFFAGFALSSGLVSLLSLWVVGFGQTAAYARSLFSVGTGLVAASQFPLRVSIMANLRGLIFGLLGARLRAIWIQALTIVVSMLVLLWVAVSARKPRGSEALVIAITAGVVVSYYLFIHDLGVLLIPIVITLDRFIFLNGDTNINAEITGSVFNRAAAWMAAALLVAPMGIFLMPEHFYLLSLPLCAFMVILIRSFPREQRQPSSARF
ncbi:MAG: glycosyltransferase family 87 protein [Terriglobales bacterium]